MNKGSFKKGSIPHNKGKKLQDYLDKKQIEKIKETQFKSGEEHTGKNHTSWKGGVQKPKSDCVHLWDGTNKRVRRPRKNYEDAYGKIPDGYVIYHKDLNKDNDHPSNLEAISRGELLKRNLDIKKRNERIFHLYMDSKFSSVRSMFTSLNKYELQAFKDWFTTTFHYECLDNNTTSEAEYESLKNKLENLPNQ